MTKTMCCADCWADHRPVVSKFNLLGDLKSRKLPKETDLSKFNQDSMRQTFIDDTCNYLGAMNLSPEDLEENSTCFQNMVHSSAVTT